MKSTITLTCDIYNACRTNTAMALTSDGHYDFQLLAKISGARFDTLINNLKWCAENKETSMAIETVQHFAEALLSAYEIQEKTY